MDGLAHAMALKPLSARTTRRGVDVSVFAQENRLPKITLGDGVSRSRRHTFAPVLTDVTNIASAPSSSIFENKADGISAKETCTALRSRSSLPPREGADATGADARATIVCPPIATKQLPPRPQVPAPHVSATDKSSAQRARSARPPRVPSGVSRVPSLPTTLPAPPTRPVSVTGWEFLVAGPSWQSDSELSAVKAEEKGADENLHDVAEYAWQINQQSLSDQLRWQVSSTYLDSQQQLTPRMRGVLINWIVEVHRNYKLRTPTLFLCVSLVDRYLDKRQVPKIQLQLVGVAALLVAAKFEEVSHPEVQDMVYITDNAYSREEVLQMEVDMLNVLEFRIAVPTAAHFIERVAILCRCEEADRNLAQFILELTLTECSILAHTASQQAAAAVLSSHRILHRVPAWPAACAEDMATSEESLEPCVAEMRAIWRASENSQFQAVRQKFMHRRRKEVSNSVPEEHSPRTEPKAEPVPNS